VGEPAEGGGAVGGEEGGHGDQSAEQKQPVAGGVEAGEGDVGGADLQRHDDVGEAGEQGGGEQQQHDHPVHGEQLVVLFVGEQLHVGGGQFGADEQGHDAGGQEEAER